MLFEWETYTLNIKNCCLVYRSRFCWQVLKVFGISVYYSCASWQSVSDCLWSNFFYFLRVNVTHFTYQKSFLSSSKTIFFSILKLCSPRPPDWLWGPHSLLFSGYECSFPGLKRRGMKLTTYFRLVSELRMSGVAPLLPLHVFMAWNAKTILRYVWWSLYFNWVAARTLCFSVKYFFDILCFLAVELLKQLSGNYTACRSRRRNIPED